MGILHPVRSTFAAVEGLIDRLVCLVGAILFSQFPEFMQQYLQRLGGHLDEARFELARLHGSDAQAALAARVSALAADDNAIREAGAWARPFVFVHHADPAIVRATWGIFRPAVPTTAEGAVYAVAGLLFLLTFYHGAVRAPTRAAWRRWRARRSALRTAKTTSSVSEWTTR